MSGSMPGFGGDVPGSGGGERGSRRKKIAGYLKAANEIRQSYQQSYSEKWGNGNSEWDDDEKGIPGAFPDVAIVSHGDEQLVLFPSYARRHHKEAPNPDAQRNSAQSTQRNSYTNEDGPGDAEYWAREWQKYEDDRAIVDVDVRGWIYSPHRGPMTRKNRLLIGLARQLSGVPAPREASRDHSPEPSIVARHREHEARREQEKIAQEAEQILRKGRGEEQVAAHGGYSERPKYDSDSESVYGDGRKSGAHTPGTTDDPPGPGNLTKRFSWNQPSEMTQAELLTANSHLMARLRPFLTNPLVSTPITLFFYDEKTSVSRTVQTNEAGHFNIRAALEFVPTHVRVLASEHLSCTSEVKITEPKGVSLISDVDDTVKHSSIGGGAREIFRNAFIRDLSDLTIDGVKEWYNTMYDMGVGVHYVSNSPWQLFPVLVSFFQKAGLPPGSYHLKQYSGMLQGIFEPVAERKKGTLEKIMRDFPQRKFILIGDSGEADLEVYTDVVLANPGKILAIFIRDVTTPETQGFFDSAMGPLGGDRRLGRETPSRTSSWDSRKTQRSSIADVLETRPALPKRPQSEVKPQTSDGPAMGKLIDFDDEPAQEDVHESHSRIIPRSTSFANDSEMIRRKPTPETGGKRAPPPPSKPLALRGAASNKGLKDAPAASNRGTPPPPPKSRRPLAQADGQSHPLAQAQSSSDLKSPQERPRQPSQESYMSSARNKVSAAYNSLPEVRSHIPGYHPSQPSHSESSRNSSSERPPPPPPRPTSVGGSITKRLSWNSTDTSDDESYQPSDTPVNKKLDLWKRRWKRAKDILDGQGVALRSWRTGGDACIEAIQMVEKAMREMNVEGYGNNKGKGKIGEGGGEVKVKDLKR
ncbi:related to actin cytoskeleton organization and biogenesis [Phialocephala subalpina]|uniref:Related to actin cytoskeleton organization and biogenesis n=1 Tax=Phialocephala subalpina TaxID=576137 RepID=A0A1L7XM58_9HELO|nr:related to actin cytoskeleton organization and biogenesis [Phialocephala subalpina]